MVGLQPLSHQSATRGRAVTGRGPRCVLLAAEMSWNTDPTVGCRQWDADGDTQTLPCMARLSHAHLRARRWVTPGGPYGRVSAIGGGQIQCT